MAVVFRYDTVENGAKKFIYGMRRCRDIKHLMLGLCIIFKGIAKSDE